MCGAVVCAAILARATVADELPGMPPTIVVEADSFELRVDEEVAVWQGSVVARQGAHVFRTGTLTLHLDQLTDASRGSSRSAEPQRETLPANYELSAQSLSYDVGTNVIAGDGDCMLRRGNEFIAADRIRFVMEDRIAYALPGEQGRVRVQFYASNTTRIFPTMLSRPLAGAE